MDEVCFDGLIKYAFEAGKILYGRGAAHIFNYHLHGIFFKFIMGGPDFILAHFFLCRFNYRHNSRILT